MLGSIKVTVALLILLPITMVASAVALRRQEPQNPPAADRQLAEQAEKQRQRQAQLESQFPVIDYDAEEIVAPDKQAGRKAKNSRYDKRSMVSRDPTTRISEVDLLLEGYEGYYVPALPLAQSDVVVIGEVLNGQGHLSNDKGGIYTELAVRVEEVIKNSSTDTLTQGATITAEREGGIVHYANGHKRLYHLAGQGMPRSGQKYVLFLGSLKGSQDYQLVTGYELAPTGVVPVDASQQFGAYKGYSVEAFLNAVRAAVIEAQRTTSAN